MVQADTSSLVHSSQPIPLGKCSGTGTQEGGVPLLLCGPSQVKCAHKKDSYPLLRVQEVLKSMAGAGHFSMMDLPGPHGT